MVGRGWAGLGWDGGAALILYLGSSSPSDALRIVLYCELRDFSIRMKLPMAKMVRRCR